MHLAHGLSHNVVLLTNLFIQCLYAKSLEAFFDEIQNDPVKLAVIGCGCSVATQPVAAIASYWNIPQAKCIPLLLITFRSEVHVYVIECTARYKY